MKKVNPQFARLKNVIETDRLLVSGNFNELVIKDLTKVLKDYFDIKSMPELSLTKDGNAYLIEINLVATRVKTFGVLPRV